jgi:transcriptional regulator of acetoin/glycerol metabolism
MEYPWPGNVRELKSVIEYAFVIAEAGLVDVEHLPPQFAQSDAGAAGRMLPAGGSTEKTELIEALRRTNGNQTQAARLLGINRVTVWNRMRKYGVDLKKVLQ